MWWLWGDEECVLFLGWGEVGLLVLVLTNFSFEVRAGFFFFFGTRFGVKIREKIREKISTPLIHTPWVMAGGVSFFFAHLYSFN